MIKLTYAQLNNPGFSDAVARLSQKEGFSNAAVAYNVSRIYRQISVKLKEARTEFAAFSEPFTLKENGVPVKEDGPTPFPFKIQPERQAEFEEQTVAFFNTELTIESNPITIDDLGSIDISPADIMSLGGIIVEAVSASSADPQVAGLTIVPELSPSH